jgi:hypothetical protein
LPGASISTDGFQDGLDDPYFLFTTGTEKYHGRVWDVPEIGLEMTHTSFSVPLLLRRGVWIKQRKDTTSLGVREAVSK